MELILTIIILVMAMPSFLCCVGLVVGYRVLKARGEKPSMPSVQFLKEENERSSKV